MSRACWLGGLAILTMVVPVMGAPRAIVIDTRPGLEFAPNYFVVEPGESIELTLNIKDSMQHNLVIVRPNAHAAVAEAALLLDPTAPEEHDYVPESDDILWATRLLGEGESQTVAFNAPDDVGHYPFVCTVPGHAAVMFGWMHVTEDPAFDPETWAPTIEPDAEVELVPVNLAHGGEADASGAQSGHPVGQAIDGDERTRWCAPNSSANHWWQVDLGKPQTIAGLRILWEVDGTDYYYLIEGSEDGESWHMLVDKREETLEQQREHKHEVEAKDIRFVRITGERISGGKWMSFHAFDVFGTELVPMESAPETRQWSDPDVSVADGLLVGRFAGPPDINYPTALAAVGEKGVYIAVDRNASLGRSEDHGRVIFAQDTNDNGQADTFTTVSTVDSPRALEWDGQNLYVLHPPDLSVMRDTTGDGIVDDRTVLVEGIGYGIEHPRGADHTTNGLRLGIDGWLYVIVGDFGYAKATTADGETHVFPHGGMVRIQRDGTELEVVNIGWRNVYDIAISPRLDMFGRDNDDDGAGWDTRLMHAVPLAEYGYPRRRDDFKDEVLKPIVNYGGGSPTGALFISEANWPEELNNRLYTAEWNRDYFDRHELEPVGAGFKEADREPAIRIPSPTGIDMDPRGHLYVGSWKGGRYRHAGPDVGFVSRVVPEGQERAMAPQISHLSDADLVEILRFPGQTQRRMAQQEILRRGENETFVEGLVRLVGDDETGLDSRIIGVFTLVQLQGPEAFDQLVEWSAEPALREFALRALADREAWADKVPHGPFVEALGDEDPRVRLQAAIGIARIGDPELGGRLTVLLNDSDPVVAHIVERAMVKSEAYEAAFAFFDARSAELGAPEAPASEELHAVRRVIQDINRDEVVDGVIERLRSELHPAAKRIAFTALARLHYVESMEWDGAKDWWGTKPRPKTPYWKPVEWERSEDIFTALGAIYSKAVRDDPDFASWAKEEMERHQLDVDALPGE